MRFALLVFHAEGMAFVVDEEDFDFAIAAVVVWVGGTVGENVLVADGFVDPVEDVGELALEDGAEAEATSHGGEGLQLILGLEIVHIAHAAAASEAHAGSSAAAHLVDKGAGADGEDGDVRRGFYFGENFVEGELGEGVTAGADEDDVFAAFDAAGAVEGFVEGVEDVGVGEAGDDERLERLGDEFLVVGEVGEDMGLEIVGDDGDVVIFAQGLEEGVGGVLHVADEVVAVGSEFEQHDGGDGGLGDAEAGDGLGDAVLEDEEVSGLEAGDELMGLVEDDAGVNVDDGDVDTERIGGVVGVLDFGSFGGGWGWRLVGVRLLLEDDGAVVGLGAGVVGDGLVGLGLLLGWGLGGGRRVLGACGVRRGDEGAGDEECAGGAEEVAGRELQEINHHLELYSEIVVVSLDEPASQRLALRLRGSRALLLPPAPLEL